MDPQSRAKDASSRLKCIKDKLLPIAGTALVAALLIAVIALAAHRRPPCPPCPTAPPRPPRCPPPGIAVGPRCFYFVEEAAEWDGGRRFCASYGAELAAVQSGEELGFVLRYGGTAQYWMGLRREGGGPWMWVNGSELSNGFSIAGRGRCAHTDGLGGVGSSECSQPKRSVCSRPQ